MRNINEMLSNIEERCDEIRLILNSDWTDETKRVLLEGRIELLKKQLSELY